MVHKHSIDALNRTLKDIKNNDKLFGGTLLVLYGDLRQTLPVIPRSTYADEINACLKSSPLWRNVEKVQLKVNMPVQMLQDPSAETFKQIQLPIRLAFAITVNKSQGQTMSICGLDLSTPCFLHGQLYVACSRVGKPSSLFVLAKDGLTKILFTL
ncbi:unnamed protein product [Diabrotica balteata]|uniref:ATP-dependent DNA helicase n=1 Tax=Diabrotica balteata TaxID=107213 RepID=A0A9N9T7C8_DIABA|nr:unnamed protein product [Diabrotica balteata]